MLIVHEWRWGKNQDFFAYLINAERVLPSDDQPIILSQATTHGKQCTDMLRHMQKFWEMTEMLSYDDDKK